MDGHKAAIVRHNSSGGQLMDTPPRTGTHAHSSERSMTYRHTVRTSDTHRMPAEGDRCRKSEWALTRIGCAETLAMFRRPLPALRTTLEPGTDSSGAGLVRSLGPPRFTGRHNLARLKVANEARPVIADRAAEARIRRSLAPLAPIAQRADGFINRGRGLFFSHPVSKEIFVAHAQNFSPALRREMRKFTLCEKYAVKGCFLGALSA